MEYEKTLDRLHAEVDAHVKRCLHDIHLLTSTAIERLNLGSIIPTDGSYIFNTIPNNQYPYVVTSSFVLSDKWQMTLGGNLRWTPMKNEEPNWFNRKMMEFCFGVKWARLK